jgi:hypothetical protein
MILFKGIETATTCIRNGPSSKVESWLAYFTAWKRAGRGDFEDPGRSGTTGQPAIALLLREYVASFRVSASSGPMILVPIHHQRRNPSSTIRRKMEDPRSSEHAGIVGWKDIREVSGIVDPATRTSNLPFATPSNVTLST